MGGAISRSEAILRLHIPWVRIVIQVKALALATRAGWFGRWIFAEDSRQHESCDHGHAPPANGSVGQRGDNKSHDQHKRASCDSSDTRRVGEECGSKCKSRESVYIEKKAKHKTSHVTYHAMHNTLKLTD